MSGAVKIAGGLALFILPPLVGVSYIFREDGESWTESLYRGAKTLGTVGVGAAIIAPTAVGAYFILDALMPSPPRRGCGFLFHSETKTKIYFMRAANTFANSAIVKRPGAV